MMNFEKIVTWFSAESTLPNEQVNSILTDDGLRSYAVKYLRQNPNREFAKAILEKVLRKRRNQDFEMGTNDNIMFSCYLVGLHINVEDSLIVWQAKNVDFDAYCGVDVQLLAFAGVDNTLKYLKALDTEESRKAIDYIVKSKEAGDFDDIESYFSEEQQPWWI